MSTFFRRFNSRMQYKRKKKHRLNPILLIVLMLTLMVFASTLIEKRLMPIAIALAEARAQNLAHETVNNAINEYIMENDITYEDLYTMKHDSNGYVTAISSNTAEMNKIKAAIALNVQEKVHNMDSGPLGIPLGALTGYDLLSDFGPKIPITLLTSGTSNLDFKNSFESAGINQTKHEIYIQAECAVTIILPGKRANANVVSTIPIVETIIVGNVPSAFLGSFPVQ